jgi:hypothetical protein
MTNVNLTPDTARELLAIAGNASKQGDALSKGAWIGPALSVFIGLLMGAFLMASIYLLPTATGLQALLISAGYAAGIGISVTAYNLSRKVTPTGWVKQYQKGLSISCVVFFLSLALSFLIDERTPWLWVPLAIATVLPISILGSQRSTQ